MVDVAEVLLQIDQALEGLKKVWGETRSSNNVDAFRDRILRWKQKWSKWIRTNISADEAGRFDHLDDPSSVFILGEYYNPWEDPEKDVNRFTTYLKHLRTDVENDPDQFHAVNAQEDMIDEKYTTTSKNVFVVHGHDGEALAALRDLLRSEFAIEPVILAQKPAQGRTIIEKFEEEARKCGYAFVLMTPDDQVSKDGKLIQQARPNVIFELGWFYGHLGRSNVCILFKKGMQIHSDLDGINRIEYHTAVGEAYIQIRNELRSAGLLQEKSK